MGKVIDITEKLDLSGNPYIKIKDEKLEVNTDAATMLKIMNVYGDADTENVSPKELMKIYEIIFPEKSRKAIEKMKIGFSDLMKVIQTAQQLIMGKTEDTGEE